MSHQATTWVMAFSESRLADRLVMLAIAHRISNDDGDAWPSVATIQKEANISERQVYDSIKSLGLIGELTIREEASERGTNRYHMPKFLAWWTTQVPAKFAPPLHKMHLHNMQYTPAQNADEPSLEPSSGKIAPPVLHNPQNLHPPVGGQGGGEKLSEKSKESEILSSREQEQIDKKARKKEAIRQAKRAAAWAARSDKQITISVQGDKNVEAEPKRSPGEEIRRRRKAAIKNFLAARGLS